MYDNTYSTTSTSTSSGIGIVPGLIILVIVVLMMASMWKLFKKAGRPGWAAIIPIYNTYILLDIANKPVWWLLLFFIPFVNIIMIIIVYLELAKVFGKSAVFGVFGLILFPYVGFPMLAFGSAQYTDPRGGGSLPTAGPTVPPVTPPTINPTTPPPPPPAV